MINKISKTVYPEIADMVVKQKRLDNDDEVMLTKFQYVEWTQLRSIYVPADITADGIFYLAGCRYELPRRIDIDGTVYLHQTGNLYRKEEASKQ